MKLILYTLLFGSSFSAAAQPGTGFEETMKRMGKPAAATQRPSFPDRYGVIGGGYQLGLAQGNFRQGMNAQHSLMAQGALPVTGLTSNLQLGAEIGYGIYAAERYRINYRAGVNYIDASINYTSSVLQGGVQATYLFGKDRLLTPYFTVRAGYMGFFSGFTIEDNDPLACRVLEQENILRDGSFYKGYGAGIRWRVGQEGRSRRHFVDLSVSHITGDPVDYANMDRLHRHGGPVETTKGRPVQARFVAAGSNDVHEHTIAEVFRNRLNLVQVRLSYVTYLRR